MDGGVGVLMAPGESTEERIVREMVKRFKQRLRHALALSGKGQNEVAREVGASQSVASEWFDEAVETLPGGRFLIRLPGALRVNGHWLVTGEGQWHPEPKSGRKDVLLMEGIEIGVRSTIAEMKKTITGVEDQLDQALQSATARARAAFEDAAADAAGAAERPRRRDSGGPR